MATQIKLEEFTTGIAKLKTFENLLAINMPISCSGKTSLQSLITQITAATQHLQAKEQRTEKIIDKINLLAQLKKIILAKDLDLKNLLSLAKELLVAANTMTWTTKGSLIGLFKPKHATADLIDNFFQIVSDEIKYTINRIPYQVRNNFTDIADEAMTAINLLKVASKQKTNDILVGRKKIDRLINAFIQALPDLQALTAKNILTDHRENITGSQAEPQLIMLAKAITSQYSGNQEVIQSIEKLLQLDTELSAYHILQAISAQQINQSPPPRMD